MRGPLGGVRAAARWSVGVRATGRRLAGVALLVVASAVIVAGALLGVVVGVPAAAVAVAAPTARPRRGRFGRTVAVAIVYAGIEISGLTAATGRWIRFRLDRDAARDRRGRIRALQMSLDRLRRAASRFGGLDVVAAADTELPPGPLIVCGRHGGIGGAFLLAHLLLTHRRLPRVVLKQTLAWDPLIDTLLSRIPHAFINPRPGDDGATAARIGALARGMAADDALLIFPEGGNFTERRRVRAIRRLRRRGRRGAAERAARLRHVLPPHPDGVFAAIEAAPDAAVVFVAHTGLDHLRTAADVWRALPLRLPVVITWWTVPAAEVPRLPEQRLGWLEENWALMDGWVARNQAPL